MKGPSHPKAAFEEYPEYFEITDGIIEQVDGGMVVVGLVGLSYLFYRQKFRFYTGRLAKNLWNLFWHQ